MSTILQTNTVLEVVSETFSLKTEYSGETNPNVTFNVLFTITDGLNVIIGAEIVIGENTYVTDNNGQVSVDFIRGNYNYTINKIGYSSESGSFTVLDQNLNINEILTGIGSFDESFDESFEK